MSKITEILPQKKNPHRFNIFIDGEFAFGADEDLVVNRRLVVGKEVYLKDLERILLEAEAGKLIERLYRLLNIRPRSEKEIRNYLKNLSFKRKIRSQEEISPFIVETIVHQLKQKELLNDEEFARSWVESRRKKKGLRVIKQELFQKGIDREIIEEVISYQSSAISERETAEKLLEKKMTVWKNLPTLELNEKSLRDLKKKAYEFLLRRGFDYEVVRKVVENTLRKR